MGKIGIMAKKPRAMSRYPYCISALGCATALGGATASGSPTRYGRLTAWTSCSPARLTLADAHLRREGKGGLALMDEIKARITDTLQRFVAEMPYEVARPDIILVAARKIRALMQAAREGARPSR